MGFVCFLIGGGIKSLNYFIYGWLECFMNDKMKPSERIRGVCRPNHTPHIDDVRREIDALHDRVEALELDNKINNETIRRLYLSSCDPKQSPESAPKCNGDHIYGAYFLDGKHQEFYCNKCYPNGYPPKPEPSKKCPNCESQAKLYERQISLMEEALERIKDGDVGQGGYDEVYSKFAREAIANLAEFRKGLK